MKHVLRKYETGSFDLFESLYPPGLKQPRHAHALASLSFVLTGNYLEDYGRRALMRRPSTIVLHPPQESHAVDFQRETRILTVHFDSKRLAYIRDHGAILDFHTSYRTAQIAWLGDRIHAAGFADQSHLTRIFKNYYGLTPSQYRQIYRKC